MTTKSLSAYQMKKRNQTPLDLLIQEYLSDMQLRNLSVLTVKVNGNMLRMFLRKMAGERKTLRLAEVTPDLARAYIAGRQQQTTIYQGHPVHPELAQRLSPRTIHREVRILRAFGSWLVEQGLDNPFGGLKLPKLPSQLIEILDTDEIAKLFSIYNDGTQFGVRWQAMFAFALDTGVRIAEMIGLKADDLDFDRFRAKVWGKGAKERYVFFGNRTQRYLMRYANLYRQPDCPAFFQSLEGGALTPESAQRIIWHARKNAGIQRIHWHLLRHTFGRPFGRLITASQDATHHQEWVSLPWRFKAPSSLELVSFQGTGRVVRERPIPNRRTLGSRDRVSRLLAKARHDQAAAGIRGLTCQAGRYPRANVIGEPLAQVRLAEAPGSAQTRPASPHRGNVFGSQPDPLHVIR